MTRDNFDVRLTNWLQDGPERASRDRVDATFAPLARIPQRASWRIRLDRAVPSRRVLTLLAAAAVLIALAALGASGGGGRLPIAPAPSPAPSAATGPVFTLEMKAPANKTYVQSPTPAVASCTTPASGPWDLQYTASAFGTTDFLQLTLHIQQGAATPPGSNDFRLSIDDTDFIDELGVQSGSHGSTGKVTVSVDGATAHIRVDGIAAKPGSDTTLTPVTLDLTCPQKG